MAMMMTKKLQRAYSDASSSRSRSQAAIGSRKVIAREQHHVRCVRTCLPSATAAISRVSSKLLEKQKAGKKRMKMLVDSVEVPQEAFIAALSTGETANDRDTKDKIAPLRRPKAEHVRDI